MSQTAKKNIIAMLDSIEYLLDPNQERIPTDFAALHALELAGHIKSMITYKRSRKRLRKAFAWPSVIGTIQSY